MSVSDPATAPKTWRPPELRLHVADPYLQMTFSVLATSDEGGVQGDRDRRRRFRRIRGMIPKRRAGCQCAAAHGLFVVAGADREHLLQHVSGRPIGHQGGQVSLKLIQLRCRPAMRRPVDPNLDRTTRGAAKSGKPHRDLTEERGYRMIPVVLHMTNTATASTIRPPHRVGSGLSGDDLPLHPRKQKLRFGQAQTQSGDIAEIVGLIDLHDVRALSVAFSAGFRRP